MIDFASELKACKREAGSTSCRGRSPATKTRRASQPQRVVTHEASVWVRPKAIDVAKLPELNANAYGKAEAATKQSKRKVGNENVRVAASVKRRSIMQAKCEGDQSMGGFELRQL